MATYKVTGVRIPTYGNTVFKGESGKCGIGVVRVGKANENTATARAYFAQFPSGNPTYNPGREGSIVARPKVAGDSSSACFRTSQTLPCDGCGAHMSLSPVQDHGMLCRTCIDEIRTSAAQQATIEPETWTCDGCKETITLDTVPYLLAGPKGYEISNSAALCPTCYDRYTCAECHKWTGHGVRLYSRERGIRTCAQCEEARYERMASEELRSDCPICHEDLGNLNYLQTYANVKGHGLTLIHKACNGLDGYHCAACFNPHGEGEPFYGPEQTPLCAACYYVKTGEHWTSAKWAMTLDDSELLRLMDEAPDDHNLVDELNRRTVPETREFAPIAGGSGEDLRCEFRRMGAVCSRPAAYVANSDHAGADIDVACCEDCTDRAKRRGYTLAPLSTWPPRPVVTDDGRTLAPIAGGSGEQESHSMSFATCNAFYDVRQNNGTTEHTRCTMPIAYEVSNGAVTTRVCTWHGTRAKKSGWTVKRRHPVVDAYSNLDDDAREVVEAGKKLPKGLKIETLTRAQYDALPWVRTFSACGPCISVKMLRMGTTNFRGVFWHSNPDAQPQEWGHFRIATSHMQPCPSCTDHAHTQYPHGSMD